MLDKKELNQLFQYSYSLTNNRDDGYDLLQSGLEKYLNKNDNILDNKMAYVRKIIRNQFIDNQRRKQKIVFEALQTESTLAIDTLSLEDLIIAEDEIKIIWEKLDEGEREIVYLWALKGYTAKEISNETGQPRGTVLSKIHRIREKLTTGKKPSKKVGETDG